MDATAISFRLAPRLNAAGRLHSARLAYDLLRATDATRAYTLAGELEELNTRRRDPDRGGAGGWPKQQLAETLADRPAHPDGAQSALRARHRWAGRRQAGGAVLPARRGHAPGGTETRGSARSIPEFDISQALDAGQRAAGAPRRPPVGGRIYSQDSRPG